jgi:hypothetical protein
MPAGARGIDTLIAEPPARSFQVPEIEMGTVEGREGPILKKIIIGGA